MHHRFASLLIAGFVLFATPASAADPQARDISAPGEINQRTGEFERNLTDLGLSARLKCSLLVEVLDDTGGRNPSFGGICDMQLTSDRSTTIMLCNDTMVGRLTVKAHGFSVDRNALVKFTATNCPGGG